MILKKMAVQKEDDALAGRTMGYSLGICWLLYVLVKVNSCGHGKHEQLALSGGIYYRMWFVQAPTYLVYALHISNGYHPLGKLYFMDVGVVRHTHTHTSSKIIRLDGENHR